MWRVCVRLCAPYRRGRARVGGFRRFTGFLVARQEMKNKTVVASVDLVGHRALYVQGNIHGCSLGG